MSNILVTTEVVNDTTQLVFNLSVVARGLDQCTADFLDPMTITSASAFDANGNLITGATFLSDSGFDPNAGAVSTPEPSSLMMLGIGLLGLAGLGLKKSA